MDWRNTKHSLRPKLFAGYVGDKVFFTTTDTLALADGFERAPITNPYAELTNEKPKVEEESVPPPDCTIVDNLASRCVRARLEQPHYHVTATSEVSFRCKGQIRLFDEDVVVEIERGRSYMDAVAICAQTLTDKLEEIAKEQVLKATQSAQQSEGPSM